MYHDPNRSHATDRRRAFVSGATGFLGITLTEELWREGWDVTALHRPSSDLTELRRMDGLRFVCGDVTDRESLEKAIPDGVDAVFHAAGSVEKLPHSDERSRYAVNQGGTRNMVEVSLRKNVGRFIHTSTVVTHDFSLGRVDESTPPNPSRTDHYIRSKREAEIEVERGLESGLDAVVLNPSAIFGAYDKSTWSQMFTEIQRGLPTPFMAPGALSASHMRKVAQAHVQAYHRGRRGERYILGGPDVTILEISQAVARLLGRPGPRWVLPAWLFKAYARVEHRISLSLGREPQFPPHTADTLCYVCLSDSGKAMRELGYDPSSLEEMLRDCHQWMVESGRLPPTVQNEEVLQTIQLRG
jgi:nucleoside-diphosphate-sugar epimerase